MHKARFFFLLVTGLHGYPLLQEINSLPNDKILDQTKLKACADDKINVTQKLQFVIESVKTSWEKGKMLVTSIFLLFPQCFQQLSFVGS